MHTASLCLLVGASNPFTFKVIIHMYDPISFLNCFGFIICRSFPFFFLPREVLLALVVKLVSVQFSPSVMSDSLQPHGQQHARLPCPSPMPEAYQTHVHGVGDAIQPSHPLPSPSPPTFNLSQYQGLFQ